MWLIEQLYVELGLKLGTGKKLLQLRMYFSVRLLRLVTSKHIYVCNTYFRLPMYMVLRIEIIKIPCKLFINMGSAYSRNFFAFSTMLEMLENTFRMWLKPDPMLEHKIFCSI